MIDHREDFQYEIIAVDKDTKARAGILRTPNGEVPTPVFMPVGTQATVKTMSQGELEDMGAQIILCNTYHLYLRPGHELIEKAGGLHKFISWERPMLTDSGGYQVFSLADLNKVTEEGVSFQSHFDGSYHLLTPERAVEIQHALGADIIMVFDECTSYPCSYEQAKGSSEMTLRWAQRSIQRHRSLVEESGKRQALFGIVQGSVYPDLRVKSAERLMELDLPGYAIGGLAVGEPKAKLWEIVDCTAELLPADRPRYLMGIGHPADLVEGVARGVDMFDCVIPTRNARNGTIFTRKGKMVLKNAQYAHDFSPIDPQCPCATCRRYCRAYIRHLFQTGEILALRLATFHSLYFFLETMRQMRQSIIEGTFSEWRAEFYSEYEA